MIVGIDYSEIRDGQGMRVAQTTATMKLVQLLREPPANDLLQNGVEIRQFLKPKHRRQSKSQLLTTHELTEQTRVDGRKARNRKEKQKKYCQWRTMRILDRKLVEQIENFAPNNY